MKKIENFTDLSGLCDYPDMLVTADVANFMRISEQSARRFIKENLNFIQLRRKILVPKVNLQKYLEKFVD